MSSTILPICISACGFLLSLAFSKQQQKKSLKQILQSSYLKIKQKSCILDSMSMIENKQLLIEPYLYTVGHGGKKLRLVLSIIITQMFSTQIPDVIYKIGTLIESLHSASLMIDDFQDSSHKRRGLKCAYLVFGQDFTINAANLMYFVPMKKLIDSVANQQQKLNLIKIYTQELITSHLGQAEQVLMHKIKVIQQLPKGIEDYFRITSAKTSSLLKMLVRMIAQLLKDKNGKKLISDKNLELLIEIMQQVGISFQIIDDILNLQHHDDGISQSKGLVAEDLHEKKYTLIIHYLRHNKQFMQNFLILPSEPFYGKLQQIKQEQIAVLKKTNPIVLKLLDIIQKSTAKQNAKCIAQGIIKNCLLKVNELDNVKDRNNLKQFIKFVVERKY